MIRFALGFFMPFAALFTTNLVMNQWHRWYGGQHYAFAAVTLCGVPTLCALAVAAIMHHRRPRRMFQRHTGRPIAPLACGLTSALVAVALTVPLVVVSSETVPDAALLAAASLLGTMLVMLLAARRRPGHCIRCDYDLRSSLGSGRCPECGLSLSALMGG